MNESDNKQNQVVEVITPETVSPATMDTFTRAEIDMQIATAKRYPRSVAKVLRDAEEMATIDVETSESCIYHLPRGEGTIPGPSIRLAEIVGCAWGNLRYGARIVGESGDFIVAQGVCHDLEKNTAATVEVQRRIVDKHGKRFKVDMIGVTGMAACSVALRNAILRVVPRAYVNQIYHAAVEVAVGDAKTLSDRRAKVVHYFTQTLGVTKEKFLTKLGRETIEDITIEDLEILTGIKTAIKQGDVKVDEAFPGKESEPLKKPEAKKPQKKEIFASEEQCKAIYATGASKGMDEDAVLLFISDGIGRQVISTKELTTVEASQVIDALNKLPDKKQ